MKQLTAAERRFFENATVIGAQRVLFAKLGDMGVPVFKLSELAETTSGGTPDRNNSAYYGGEIRWMKSGELTDGQVTEIEETITEEGLANSNAKIFPVGTLLIALYGATVGKTGILSVEAATNQAVCGVTPKRKDVRVRYLFWFLRRKREDFLQTSFGGAQPNISQKILRDTLVSLPSPEIQDAVASFLDAVEMRLRDKSVPLPELPAPLAEQRRVVARIEELAAQIHEARTLRHQAAEEAEVLALSELGSVFDAEAKQRGITRLEDLLVDAGYGSSEKCDTERVEGATPVLRIPNVASEQISLTGMKYARLNKRDSEKLLLSEGDVLVVRTNGSLELVGRSAVVPKLDEPFAFASYMIRLRFDQNRISSAYAQRMLQHLRVSGALVDFARTTAGQYNVSLGRLRDAEIPVPPLAEQRRIVAELDALQAEVDALKRLQAETAAELDALLPAILDKAFKGEF